MNANAIPPKITRVPPLIYPIAAMQSVGQEHKTSRNPLNIRIFALLLISPLFLALFYVVKPVGNEIVKTASLFVNRDRVRTITELQSLSLANTNQAAQLCTSTGLKLWTSLQGNFPGPHNGFVIQEFRTSGDLCDVKLTCDSVDGLKSLDMRLIHESSGWKFDDIYLESAYGRELGFWLSWAEEYPLLAVLKIAKPEIKAAYGELKAGVKQGAESLHDLASILNFFK